MIYLFVCIELTGLNRFQRKSINWYQMPKKKKKRKLKLHVNDRMWLSEFHRYIDDKIRQYIIIIILILIIIIIIIVILLLIIIIGVGLLPRTPWEIQVSRETCIQGVEGGRRDDGGEMEVVDVGTHLIYSYKLARSSKCYLY